MSPHITKRCVVAGAWLCAFLAQAAHSRGQESTRPVQLPAENRLLAKRLDFAHELVKQRKWHEALDEYEGLLRESGEALVPVTTAHDLVGGCQRSVQLRWLCHQALAQLPTEALQLYRARVDAQAEKRLAQGLQQRSEMLLQRLVTETFCGTHTARALDALGDLAFERGDFAAAWQWWSMLSSPPSRAEQRREGLRYPGGAQVEPARSRAKLLLSLHFLRQGQLLRLELEHYRRLHPQAAGKLLGRAGVYHELLRTLPVPDIAWPEEQWLTLAGNPARTGWQPSALTRASYARPPAWRVQLAPALDGPCPAIVDDRVLIASAQQVRGFDLHSGAELFAEPERKPPARGESQLLTATHNFAYTVLGSQCLDRAVRGNVLVCLDHRSGKLKQRERWRAVAQGPNGTPAVFEGAPLVHEDTLYITLSWLEQDDLHTALRACDAATGKLLWQQALCVQPSPSAALRVLPRRQLLTLAGTRLLYVSPAGLTIAADCQDGTLLWAVRYPYRDESLSQTETQPEPALAQLGLIVAAPCASGHIFAWDAHTGLLRWHLERLDTVRLLGCHDGTLVFATAAGSRAVRLADGVLLWSQPAEGQLRSHGRGLLAGGWVVWPVVDPLTPVRLLALHEGRPQLADEHIEPTLLRHLVAGQCAWGGGYLVIATPSELLAYGGAR